MKEFKDLKVLVRGAGDIASGIIWNLNYAGFKVVCTDIEKPSCIRREVAYSEAIFDGEKLLDGVRCVFAKGISYIDDILNKGNVALIVDEKLDILHKMHFDVVVDAILAKKNLGTNIDMADVVIGVGPGFTAGKDCHFAIETMRGHTLAKIYEEGSPLPNTGIPGLIGGHASDRVMHSPCEGIFHNVHKIGDIVKKDEILSQVEECKDYKPTGKTYELKASIDGVLRGILRDGFYANNHLKCADIDPRLTELENCFSISDKARSIGGAVLATILHAECIGKK